MSQRFFSNAPCENRNNALSAIVFAILIRSFNQALALLHHPFLIIFIEDIVVSTKLHCTSADIRGRMNPLKTIRSKPVIVPLTRRENLSISFFLRVTSFVFGWFLLTHPYYKRGGSKSHLKFWVAGMACVSLLFGDVLISSIELCFISRLHNDDIFQNIKPTSVRRVNHDQGEWGLPNC